MGVIDLGTGLNLEEIQTAQEIADRDDFSTLIIDASLDGIIAMNTQLRYTLWNKAMERISGYKKEEMLGKHAFDVFPWLRDVGMDKLYAEALAGRTSKCPLSPYEVTETGVKGFFEQTNVPLYDEHGKVVGLLAVVRDVTETKKAMDELELRVRELEERL